MLQYQANSLQQNSIGQVPQTVAGVVSPRSTPEMNSPFFQYTSVRSTRLSPLNSNIDFRKIETEFPGKSVSKAKRWGRDSIFSGDGNLPETINEDLTEEEAPVYVRHSRFKEMRDYNEFGKE